MANCVDFNRKYKFKLSHSNDIDRYASVIDEEIENYLGELNEEECNEPEELILTKKDLIIDILSFSKIFNKIFHSLDADASALGRIEESMLMSGYRNDIFTDLNIFF